MLTMVSLSSSAQVFIKSSLGFSASNPGGLVTDCDLGYQISGKHNLSIGYYHNSFISKVFYNTKYGYSTNSFIFFGGIGLVNHFYNEGQTYKVSAYGSYDVGFEYHTEEILKGTNLYLGADVFDKTFSIKIGIRSFYKK